MVFDPVGGDAFPSRPSASPSRAGSWSSASPAATIPSAALNHALVKNYSILGLHWGLYERVDPAAIPACHAELTRLVDAGLIRTLVAERLTLADVPDGLRRLGAGTTIGRLVFQP